MTNSSLRYWLNIAGSALAGLGFVLVLFDGALLFSNRADQAQLTARGQYITQTVQLSNVSQAIIRAAATAAVNNNNTRLGDLLTQNGIRYQAAEPAASAPAPVAAATPAPRPAAAAPARGSVQQAKGK